MVPVATLRRECPMCGEFMRLTERELVDRIPGKSQVISRKVREWICPECDYFEEHDAADEEGAGGETE
jgi:C4-type Zn-finger protein